MDRKEYEKEWRNKNKDKCREYTKKWQLENKEKRNATVDSWRRRNPDKVAKTNKKASAKWHAANPGHAAARVRKRQAMKKQRTPSWADFGKIREFYEEAARLTKETGEFYEVDHIIPLQGEFVSGLHVETNLRVIKRSENRSKGNKI